MAAENETILERVPPPADLRLAYGQDALQLGDLRLPLGTAPHAVVVGMHGGYWRARYGLDYFGHLCAALTAAGVATWNIEYRRLGNEGGGWPGTLADVGRAVDYLRVLAPSYGLDLAQVVTVGHSAGGHLALWTAGRHRLSPESALYASHPLPLRGVVALAGVCDLRRAWELRLSDNVTEQLLGGTPEQVPERYAAASPADLLPLGVPQVLIHGTEDTSVPYAISAEYSARTSAAGDEVELVTLADAGHFEIVDPQAAEFETVRRATLRMLGIA